MTDEFFRVLGEQPSIGRMFTRDEAKEGGTGAAMISDRYARQMCGDPTRAPGRTLRLFNRSVPIVGVLPSAFNFPIATDIWFTERSQENGLRMALGANARDMMLGRGLTLAGIGLVAGLLAAIACARLVGNMLFDVKPHDVITYIGVVASLGFLSLLAAYLPARRATRIDPLRVLRQE